MTQRHTTRRARYRRGLNTSVINNSSAFGFSVMITSSFGLVSHLHRAPTGWEVEMFAFGAVAMISGIEAIVSRGFRRRPRPHPSNVVLLGTASNLVSVAVALAGGYGMGVLVPEPWVWAVAPAVATAAYVLAEGGELALAEWLEAGVFGEDEAEGWSDDNAQPGSRLEGR